MDLLSPATFLMNTCIMSSASGDESRDDTEEQDEMLLERMMVVVDFVDGVETRNEVRWNAREVEKSLTRSEVLVDEDNGDQAT